MPTSKRSGAAPSVERAFIYCRQSKTDGDGERSVSLASQERMLRDLADERNMVIVGVEIDADVRGWRDEKDRPGLRSALERARAGEFDALLFYDISRVARDVFILERLVRELSKHGVRPVSLKEPQIEDPFYRQILAAIAEKYTRDLSAHATRGIAEVARRGVPHGYAPYGYRKVNRSKYPQDLELLLPERAFVIDDVHPERVEIVREIFRRFLAGDTITEITVDLNARRVPNSHGAQWSARTIGLMLRNRTYTGEVHAGETHTPDAHEAIISLADFERVQAILEPRRRYRRKRKEDQSWLEGFIYHECGQHMYLILDGERATYFRCHHASNQSNQWPGTWSACTLKPKSRLSGWLEDEIWKTVARDLATIIPADEAIAEAAAEYARMAPDAGRARAEIARSIARLNAEYERAEALYLDGARSREWLNQREAKIAVERAELMEREAALPPEPDTEAIRDAAIIMRNIAGELATISPEGRRVIMARLGIASFGPAGTVMHYAPEIAALIPGARSLADADIISDVSGGSPN